LFSAEQGTSRTGSGGTAETKPTTLLVAALVGLYAAQLVLIALSAYTDPHPGGSRGLPLLVLDDRDDSVFSTKRMVESLALLLIVCLESTLLYLIWRRLRDVTRRIAYVPVAVGTTVMLALSLCAPVLLSADPYLYVGYSLIGSLAYSPPAAPFGGEYAVINKWWGTPLLPAPYGPLFIGYLHALLSAVPSLTLKLEALRIANSFWFLLALWFLRQARTASASLSLIALNPAIAYLFVANAHNDIIGITLILGALALAVRYPVASVAMMVAATLIKAPLAIIGLPVLSRLRAERRAGYVAATLFCAAATSLLAGGGPYVRALRIDASAHLITAPELHVALIAVAVVALTIGLMGKRWAQTASFAMPAFAARMFSWYSLWGLPYAAVAGRLAAFAILLPIVAYLMESCFDTRVAKLSVALVLLGLALTTLARRRTGASRVQFSSAGPPPRLLEAGPSAKGSSIV